MISLQELFEKHFILSYDKQLRLDKLIDESRISIDYKNSIIKFEEIGDFVISVIGTHSTEENSWMWMWANKDWNLPNDKLTASLYLKEFGLRNHIDALVEPFLELKTWDPHQLAAISSGVCNASAYFRHEYEHGAAFMVIEKTKQIDSLNDNTLQHINSCINECITIFEFNHLNGIRSYLDEKNISYNVNSNIFSVYDENNKQLTLTFDDIGRLKSTNVQL